jgi:hypothetical protein
LVGGIDLITQVYGLGTDTKKCGVYFDYKG